MDKPQPEFPYTPPVSHLLTHGRIELFETEQWPDYVTQYGFTAEHIPELTRLMLDSSYLKEYGLEDPETYAGVHAMRALGQLRDPDTLPGFLTLIETIDDEYTWEEAPICIAMMGPVALPLLTTALEEARQKDADALVVISAIERIGMEYDEVKSACIEILAATLHDPEANAPDFNANVIQALVQFRAMETLPLIEQAYAKDTVEMLGVGDWEDVQVELGLKEPDPNRQRPLLFDFAPSIGDPLLQDRKSVHATDQKKKAKRKMTEKSRQQNRKHKKKKK